MPFVHITWVAGRTPEQKRGIAKRVTAALVEEGKAKLENIHVTFVDLPPTDYAEAGVKVADQKRTSQSRLPPVPTKQGGGPFPADE